MEKLRIDEFTNYSFLSNLQAAPSNDKFAYVKTNSDMEKNGYRSNIYIYDTVKNNSFKLTSFDNESNYEWLDDKKIIFKAARNEKQKRFAAENVFISSFYSISTEGGEADLLFEIPLNVQKIKVLGGGKFIIKAKLNPLKMDLESTLKMSVEDRDKMIEEAIKFNKEEADYEIMDEVPFWYNGSGYINTFRNKLYLFDSNEISLKLISHPDTDVESFEYCKEKNLVLYTSDTFKDIRNQFNELREINLNDLSEKLLFTNSDFAVDYANYIGDKLFLIAVDMRKIGVNTNPDFFILDSGNLNKITPDSYNYSVRSAVGSDCKYGGGKSIVLDGEKLYFTITKGYNSQICSIDCNGNYSEITSENGSVDCFDIVGKEIYFVGMRNHKLQEVYHFTDGKENQLTSFNDYVYDKFEIMKPEYIAFENDGVALDGWIIKPTGFDPNKKYPAILDIHGGPKTVYGDVYFHEMQYFANEGYAVFFCNPRGGDGKGDDFSDIRGKYGTVDYEDLMAFTDKVLNDYSFIDKDRVGVTGGSYGGFMTNWIITQTHRFKAAASQRSISNWISKYGVTDIGYFFVPDQQLADPWSDVDKLWEHSPMKYANNVKTPTLFLHSEEDYRCDFGQAMQMFTSIKMHGVDSRIILFRGENHELSRSGKPKHRIRRLQEIIQWFDKYLK